MQGGGENGSAAPLRSKGGQPTCLLTVVLERLFRVDAPEWEQLILKVDSGAAETVIPREMVMGAPVQESEDSRRWGAV